MNEILAIAIVLGFATLFGELFYKGRASRVAGQLFAGMLLGIPVLGFLLSGGQNILHLFAEIGLIFLLILIGLEIDVKRFSKVSRDAVAIAVSAAAVPFVLGFGAMIGLGFDHVTALVVGACLSLTAESTKALVLMELRVFKSRVGEIMMDASIIDDVIAIGLLALILFFARPDTGALWRIPIEGVIFVAFCLVLFKLAPKILHIIRAEDNHIPLFSTVLFIAFLVGWVSQTLVIGHVVGALVAGLVIQMAMQRHREEEARFKHYFKMVTLGLLAPFFFVDVGMSFSLYALGDDLALAAVILVVAVAGKLGGTLMSKAATRNLSWRQLGLIGVGMNARGAIELVIASFALSVVAITPDIFSAIVLMTLATTFSFPFIMRYFIRKDRKVMR